MIRKIKSRAAKEIRDNKLAIFFLALLAIVKLLTILAFNNSDWEPDSYMHFLELRTVYSSIPEHLNIGIGVWSKPLYSYLLGVPVSIFNSNTFFIVQAFNLLIFSFISYLIYKLVLIFTQNKKLGLLALVLSALSLTLFKSSTSALTEPIFTLTLILGFYSIIKQKTYLASFFISLSVLGRIEGLFFIGIYFLWLVLKLKNRKLIYHFLLLAIPGLIWNFLGFLQTGYPLYIFDNGYPSVPGAYGYGQIYSFGWQFLTKELVVSLLFGLGLLVFIKNFKKIERKLELSLLLLWTVLFFIAQSILWWKGLFGSAGLMRYFVSTIPFMILFAAIVLNYWNIRHKFKILSTFLVLQVIILSIFVLGIIPSRKEFPIQEKEFPIQEDELIKAGQWLNSNMKNEDYLGSDRPEVIYYAQRDLSNSTIFYKEDLLSKKVGYYVWTRSWGEVSSKISKAEIDTLATEVYSIDNEVFIYLIK